MRKILILLSLSLVFLNASPYNLERLKQEENSIAKDYYIYRLLEKKTISKKEAEGLNSHIFRYVGKIKSELEKIIPVKIFIDPKYAPCYNYTKQIKLAKV